jgi:hypothetical protein
MPVGNYSIANSSAYLLAPESVLFCCVITHTRVCQSMAENYEYTSLEHLSPVVGRYCLS